MAKKMLATQDNLHKFILREVGRKMKVDKKCVLSKSQERNNVQARQMSFLLIRVFSDKPITDIGFFIGMKDRATVEHGIRHIITHIRLYNDIREVFDSIGEYLYALGYKVSVKRLLGVDDKINELLEWGGWNKWVEKKF